MPRRARRLCLACGVPTSGSRCSTHEIKRDRNLARAHLDTLYARHRGICQLGGEAISRPQASIDHIIPLAKGGADHPSNWTLSCLFHNSQKRDG